MISTMYVHIECKYTYIIYMRPMLFRTSITSWMSSFTNIIYIYIFAYEHVCYYCQDEIPQLNTCVNMGIYNTYVHVHIWLILSTVSFCLAFLDGCWVFLSRYI